MISAILGMAGGVLLLATLFCFLPHGEAIPTHAAVQIVSNSTRVATLLGHVDWRTVGRFCLGAMPGMLIGTYLLWALGDPGRSEPYLKTIVGAYILMLTFLPSGNSRSTAMTWWDFPLVGLFAGAAALTIGAMGPLIAPLFARRAFVKERLVATKAVCQAIVHVTKIPAFLWLRTIDYGKLSTLTVLMIVMVIPGTLIGRRLLTHVSDALFVRLYRVALVVAGLKILVYDGLWQLR